MNHTIFPPHDPQKLEPVHPPMIYVEKQVKWEYKQIVRNMKKEKPLDEAEINALGAESWEMTGVAQYQSLVYFYFKRLVEK